MRSTKASNAVERLRTRSGNSTYVMSARSDGLFSLRVVADSGGLETVGSPLPMDEFVQFVNGLSAAPPKRVGKLDVAFRTQLETKKPVPRS